MLNNGSRTEAEAASGATKAKITRLTLAEMIQVSQWIDSWRDVIGREKWTLGKLHEELVKKLSFPLTKENVDHVNRNMPSPVELVKVRPDNANRYKSVREVAERLAAENESLKSRLASTEVRLVDHEKRIAVLEARMTAASAEIADLLKELGVSHLNSAVRNLAQQVAKPKT